MAFLGEPLVAMAQNLGQTDNGYLPVGGARTRCCRRDSRPASDAFGYRLQGIGVNIEGSDSNFPDDSASVSVAVHADTSGQPGAKLFDLVSPTEYRAGHSFFEAPPGAYLDPSTAYVLVWSHISGTPHRLRKTKVDAEDAGARAGASIANEFYQGPPGRLAQASTGDALEIAVYTEVSQTKRFKEGEFVGPTQALVSNIGQASLSPGSRCLADQ